MITNVVLVHGLYADGSSWLDVIPYLQRAGLKVTAVQNPLTSLADDVAATRRALALQDGPTVLVGHSFAGTIISEAGDDPKVSALVYVAARAPDAGEDFGPEQFHRAHQLSVGRQAVVHPGEEPFDRQPFEQPFKLAGDAPPPAWVEVALGEIPWVVVRRGHIRDGIVPVGVRGLTRSHRFAALVAISEIADRLFPEDLIVAVPVIEQKRKDAVPALAALERVADLLMRRRVRERGRDRDSCAAVSAAAMRRRSVHPRTPSVRAGKNPRRHRRPPSRKARVRYRW